MMGGVSLITLTRLDKSKILVNLETIRWFESTPDTLVSFINGDSIIVRETLQEIEERVLEYKAKTLARLQSDG